MVYIATSKAPIRDTFETVRWQFIPVPVSLVLSLPRPCRRLVAGLSLFILIGEVNVSTDYDWFFDPIVTKVNFFHQSKNFFTSQISSKFFSQTNQKKATTNQPNYLLIPMGNDHLHESVTLWPYPYCKQHTHGILRSAANILAAKKSVK